MRLWFLSNGYGEDRAAALIASQVRARRDGVDLVAAPLVTPGNEYTSRGLAVATSGTPPPSGGFSTAGVGTFLRDLPFLGRSRQYVRLLRRLANPDDQFVAAGDVFLAGLAHRAFRKEGVHVALAKSVHGQPHTRLERHLLRRWTRLVFARDRATAEDLAAHGVRAVFDGNPLVDRVAEPGERSEEGALARDGLAGPCRVLLLPGSRTEAPANLLKLLDVVEHVACEAIWMCAWSPAIPRDAGVRSATAAGWSLSGATLEKANRQVAFASGRFDSLIAAADVVVGLAGTANEQAAAAGKPVVTLTGCGPQTTVARMVEQERLLGGAAEFVCGSAAEVAGAVVRLLASPSERRRRGDLGIARMGPTGGASRIADRLIEELGL